MSEKKLPTAQQILARAMAGGGKKAPWRPHIRGTRESLVDADLGLCKCGRPVKRILVASHRTEDKHAVTLMHEDPAEFGEDGDGDWVGTALNVAYEVSQKRSCCCLVGKEGLVTAHAIHQLFNVVDERVRAHRVRTAIVEGGA